MPEGLAQNPLLSLIIFNLNESTCLIIDMKKKVSQEMLLPSCCSRGLILPVNLH